MKLNADVRLPARVSAGDQPWVPSPIAGVERRMLERDGDEIARVTSIVRYAPGSSFAPHIHRGGEEYLVLDGVFSDESGNFPAGTYVRNPVGSHHRPYTASGCTIFVKLWWMHTGDQAQVVIDTWGSTAWNVTDDGIAALLLHQFGYEQTLLLRLAKEALLGARQVSGGEEVFVVRGRLECIGDTAGIDCPGQTWLRWPGGIAPALRAVEDSEIYVKRGHLTELPPAPTVA